MGREMQYANFQRHLNEMSGERRRALLKAGPERSFVYRFREPLLQPYVKMLARAKGRISEELEQELGAQQQALSVSSLMDSDPNAPQQLF